MPGNKIGSGKPFISIVEGQIKQKVKEGTPESERRDYELPDKTTGFKFELSFGSWTGTVEDLRIKEGKFGQVLEIEFEDATLSMGTKSKYFGDFAKKMKSGDIDKEITVAPFDFEDENKKNRRGLSIYQGGTERENLLQNYYWNDKDKKSTHGMPDPVGDTRKFGDDEWSEYFIGVKRFLIKDVLEPLMDHIGERDIKESVDEMINEGADEEIPTINENTDTLPEPREDEKKEEEIKIEDIPF